MAFNKNTREAVYKKYNAHCSYCGEEMKSIKEMQVDHCIPQSEFLMHITNNFLIPSHLSHLTEKDVNHSDNLMPACRICNKWKSSHHLELFRSEIEAQIERLNSYNSNYRFAKRYGLLVEVKKPVVFYFETLEKKIL
jgi:5-methylcytosine-specific restriction endonuclease McrA